MSKCRLLFLAANPSDTSPLALDEESRAIDQKIRASEYRDDLEQLTKWAVRPDDLLQYLNQYRPDIVHFSGHGSTTEEIVLQDASRQSKPVTTEALRTLFTTLRDNVRVVVLNACYSRSQAQAITEVIDCAIGMNRRIGDTAAITFAAAFYRAVAFGRSVQEAFDQGRAALLLEGIPEEHTPELLVRSGVVPASIYLIQSHNDIPAPAPPKAEVPQQPEALVSALRQRLLLAESPHDLRRLVYEIDVLAAQTPNNPGALMLRDDIRMALLRSELAERAAPTTSMEYLRYYRSVSASSILRIAIAGGAIYALYRVVSWLITQ